MLEGEAQAEGGDDEQQTLATFSRAKPGAVEQLRISAGLWNNRHLVHVRIWFSVGQPTPDDPGWRPSKNGVTLRESELDAAIEALEKVRNAIHSDGRSTCPAAPGERNPRPRAIAKAEAAAQAGGPGFTPTPRQASRGRGSRPE
jgi:hypothetical protein